jgi:hypothetical protein
MDLTGNTLAQSYIWSFTTEMPLVNVRPYLDAYSPLTSIIYVVPDTTVIFTINVTDPNGDPLVYRWYKNGITVSTATGSCYRLTIHPNEYMEPMVLTIKVEVTDGELSVAHTWWVVINITAPYYTITPDHDIDGGDAKQPPRRAAAFYMLSTIILPLLIIVGIFGAVYIYIAYAKKLFKKRKTLSWQSKPSEAIYYSEGIPKLGDTPIYYHLCPPRETRSVLYSTQPFIYSPYTQPDYIIHLEHQSRYHQPIQDVYRTTRVKKFR